MSSITRKLEGKVAIVTGGSRGMGEEIANIVGFLAELENQWVTGDTVSALTVTLLGSVNTDNAYLIDDQVK
ncbi:hypothetical protein INT43_006183 [Umbelopsis isabellina]|uniref:Uncharacterized protein n=1 Tax=Mortierella isabellina TaxID=91625 RepID=A0A8H7UKJ5_MORIS|nr:hypothetical protein INT43_006183 [Umbelopsis isabellina]